MADVRVASPTTAPPATKASPARDAILELKARIGKSVLGQDHLVESMLIGLLANGNLLIESLPGLAKTRAVKTLAKNLAADLSRVQFTPDLLPSDVTGAEIYLQTEKGGQFQFQKGPIFANLVLADEINRAPAKVQSALLEAMEERQVTVAGKTYKMPDLFMVLATENPIEQEGTYPLPEAQLDRFLMHVVVSYPNEETESEIIKLNRDENARRHPKRQHQNPPLYRRKRFSTRAPRSTRFSFPTLLRNTWWMWSSRRVTQIVMASH
jgi:MoxR-like ATPase